MTINRYNKPLDMQSSAVSLCYSAMFLRRAPPSPPLGLIWDVMLVWRKGNIEKTVSVLQHCVLLQWCTKVRAVLTGRSTGLGFDLAWFSSLIFRAPLCLQSSWCYIYILIFFCLHPSLYLLVSWAWWIGPWPGWLAIVLQCYDAVG